MAISRSHQQQTFQDIQARTGLARLAGTGLLTCNKVFSYVSVLSHIQLFAALWTVAHQAPLGMGFSRQECWSGLPFPTPGDLPNPGIEPTSPILAGRFLPLAPPGKADPEFCLCLGVEITAWAERLCTCFHAGLSTLPVQERREG